MNNRCARQLGANPQRSAILLCLLFCIAGFTSTASAAYNCGTGWTAYSVPGGVRCLLHVPAQGARPEGYVFYGEGAHSGSKYRHIGAVRRVGTTTSYSGSVADINGNGEAFASYIDGSFTITGTNSVVLPSTFLVTPWSETWSKVSPAQSTNPSYTTVFAQRPRFCGSNFWGNPHAKLRQFKAYRYAASFTESVSGISCALSLDSGSGTHQYDVALGSGIILTRIEVGTQQAPVPWDEAEYMNVGVRQTTSYGQWDLCQLSAFCVARSFGTVAVSSATLADTGDGVILSGSFPQTLWIPFTGRYGVRVLGIDARDDDNSRPSGLTSDDFLQYVTWANIIFNPPGVTYSFQLLYNRSYPSGAVGDISVAANTTLNNSTRAPTQHQQELMTWYADLAPDRAVSFFTHGPGMETCTHRAGRAHTDWKFSIVGSPQFGTPCEIRTGCSGFNAGDVIHYPHEMGHFFGLPHTFKEPVQSTVASASAFWNCNTVNIDGDVEFLGVFDDDTPADPLIESLACDTNAGSVTLTSGSCSQTFTLPRGNVMSYYLSPLWPFDKHITPGQRLRMHNVMQGSALDVPAASRTHRRRLY